MRKQKQIWKPVKGFNGYYVSNFGMIKSYRTGNPFVYKGKRHGAGYRAFAFRKNNKSHDFLVHRVVATHFIPNPENKPQINHIDSNRENNHVDNLEWCTPMENVHHALDSGRLAMGERNHMTDFSNNDVIDIINASNLNVFSYAEIAEAYDVKPSTISGILRGINWSHLTGDLL